MFVFYWKHKAFVPPFYGLLVYFNASWFLLLSLLKPYNVSRTSKYKKVIYSIFLLVICHLLLIFGYYVFQQNYRYSREFLLVYYTTLSLILVAFHSVLFFFLKKARKEGFNFRNIIIISSKEGMNQVLNNFNSHPEYGYRILNTFYSNEIDEKTFEEKIGKFCVEREVNEIFFSLANTSPELSSMLIRFAEFNLVKLRLLVDFEGIGFTNFDIDEYGDTPIIKFNTTPLDDWEKQILKRIFDIIISLSVILFILSWITPILAILIKLSSKGPVFFKQNRTGRDNKNFVCYKFRTMKPNAESDLLQAVCNDERITGIGNFLRKTSIDELPQFINVLKSDMSAIGPRPHMLKHTKDYSEDVNNFMLRHHIKPGITGLAQIKGFRGEIDDLTKLKKRVEYDLYYVKNWSIFLDIKILLLSSKVFFVNE